VVMLDALWRSLELAEFTPNTLAELGCFIRCHSFLPCLADVSISWSRDMHYARVFNHHS
jgi:hypothetical protein